MTAKKYFPIALFIGLQAAVLQAIDQSICASIAPLLAGGGWISFQAWAVYFMGGGTIKGGIRALIGYVIGMVASIAIWALGYYPNHDTYTSVAEQQEHSYIGRIGQAIEPVIAPLGFDWRLGIGLITGAGAKELVVSTLGVLYAEDSEAEATALAERIPLSPLTAFGYMIFVLIYFPCIATLAAIRQESGSWRWALFTALYTTALAWLMAYAVRMIGGFWL